MHGNDAISVYRINRALNRGEAIHAAALREQRRLETAHASVVVPAASCPLPVRSPTF